MLSDILCSKAKILGQTRQGATREILHKMPLPSYIHITISLFVFNENVKGNGNIRIPKYDKIGWIYLDIFVEHKSWNCEEYSQW